MSSSTDERESVVDPAVLSHAALSGLDKNMLLMTCRLFVESPEGMSVEVRGILDSASSASFISECLAQVLRLHRSSCKTEISGIGGISYSTSTQSTATFTVIPIFNLTAIIVPKVTCDRVIRHGVI